MCCSSSGYNPTPNPNWDPAIKNEYYNEYHQRHTELSSEQCGCQLQSVFLAITGIALTALMMIAIAVAGAALSPTVGGIFLITGLCLAVGVVGTTGSIEGGIWLWFRGEEPGHKLSTLNQIMLNEYDIKAQGS